MLDRSLAAERLWRVGPRHAQRSAEFLCDLQCGVLRERCPWRRLDVAYVIDSFLWLSGALTSIASLIETSAGECHTYGAWRFHLIVPEGELNQSAARILSRGGPLSTALELHTFRSPSPSAATTADAAADSAEPLKGSSTWQQRAERHRLLRPANFARFELPSLLPQSVRFVLYIDADVFGVHGPVTRPYNATVLTGDDHEGRSHPPAATSSIKSAYVHAVEELTSAYKAGLQAANKAGPRGEIASEDDELRATTALVPGQCSQPRRSPSYEHPSTTSLACGLTRTRT